MNETKQETEKLDSASGCNDLLADCRRCRHMKTYRAEDQSHVARICDADGWEDNNDGSYNMIEVSGFIPTDCIMFGSIS